MVNFRAIPNAFTDITDTAPTVEQIDMYTSGFFFPYFGPTLYIIITAKTATAKQKKRNPSMTVSYAIDWIFKREVHTRLDCKV